MHLLYNKNEGSAQMNKILEYYESPVRASKREEIIKCAKLIFVDQGIQNLSMKDIAKQCDVSLRSLYYYYRSKEDLAVDVMIYVMNDFTNIYNTTYDQSKSAYNNLAIILEHLNFEFINRKDDIKYITAFDFYFFKSYPNERYSIFLKSLQQNHSIQKVIEMSLIDRSINYHGFQPVELLATLLQALLAYAQKIIYREKVMALENLPGFGDYSIILKFYLDSLKAQ